MTKAEKYENKAARCKASASAMAGPERAIYEVLAGYYDGLAMDFRQVIKKRSVAATLTPRAILAVPTTDAPSDAAPTIHEQDLAMPAGSSA